MKKSFHSIVLLCLLIGLLSSCQKAERRVLKIDVDRVTHVAAGKSVHLSAFQLYREAAGDPDAAHAAAPPSREAVTPKWSVSDSSVATVGEDGTLRALKAGRVTVQGNWEGRQVEETIEVVNDLPYDSLPQLSSEGTECRPQSASLRLDQDRTLQFNLKFASDRCAELSLKAQAPEQNLPWKFDVAGGTVELNAAHGLIVTGEARFGNGKVPFTVWSEGDGLYPVSLANKTVLLTGDSMSEGIGWSMRGKVEAAGGHLIVMPWYSSTTVGWEAEGRMREYIEKYKPDVVFVALGSNEIFTKDMETRARAVRSINAEIGDRPAYWIGPPSWKPDQGIVHTIEENFRHGHFYNSNSLVVPRRRDGAHPTVEGYQTWTELIWDWYARVG